MKASEILIWKTNNTIINNIIYNYKEISNNYEALKNDYILVDTRNRSFTIKLPYNPKIGDNIIIIDIFKSFGTHNLIINGNGKSIDSDVDDVSLDINGRKYEIVFTGNLQGWRII